MAPSRPDRHQERGFTLVELLVVLAVMGLLAGVAVWRWPAASGGARAEAMQLATRIAAARDQAIIGGRPLAVVAEPSGYHFEVRAGGEWLPAAEPALRQRTWRRGISADLAQGAARVRFDSVGLPDRAISLALRSEKERAEVRILADGGVHVR